jgi:hypothetical protein
MTRPACASLRDVCTTCLIRLRSYRGPTYKTGKTSEHNFVVDAAEHHSSYIPNGLLKHWHHGATCLKIRLHSHEFRGLSANMATDQQKARFAEQEKCRTTMQSVDAMLSLCAASCHGESHAPTSSTHPAFANLWARHYNRVARTSGNRKSNDRNR